MLNIGKYKDKINGALSTFDRIIVKGHIRQFFSPSFKCEDMMTFLGRKMHYVLE
jgi:hypothetical protein